MSPCEQAMQQLMQQYNQGLADLVSELRNLGRSRKEAEQFLVNSVAQVNSGTSLNYVPQTSSDIAVTFIKAIVTSPGQVNFNGPDGPWSLPISPGDPDHRFGEPGLLVRYSDPITLTQTSSGAMTFIVIGYVIPQVGILYG